MFSALELSKIAAYAANRWCPISSWREDAASAAVIRMLEDKDKHDPAQSKLSTYLYKLAKWGVQGFLRAEWGRDYKKANLSNLTWCLDETFSETYSLEEVIPAPNIPADHLVYIAMRCDNIDKTPNNLTMAQQRGNLPL